MKAKLILCFFLSTFLIGYSQISETVYPSSSPSSLLPNQYLAPQDYFGSNAFLNDAVNPALINANNVDYVEGSPLGFEGDKNVLIIHTIGDKYYKFNNGNYNGYTGRIVLTLEGGLLYEFDDENIDFALINNTKVIKIKDRKNLKYFFVLDESNDYMILKRIEAKIIKGQINKLTQEKIEKDKYFVYQDFYLLKDDKIEEIKLNNKTFKLLFPKNEKKLKNYIKKNNLSIKDEKDFLNILRYNKTL